MAVQLGASFVVYYGEINEDSDGPAEACVPIDPARVRARDPGMRRKPAHREAYVRITKAQVAFPQIASAYDRVSAWVTSHGLTLAGHPRDVYFRDFAAAPARRGMRRRGTHAIQVTGGSFFSKYASDAAGGRRPTPRPLRHAQSAVIARCTQKSC